MKDLGVLKSLVETFAKQGEIPVLSGTESWEIRSLAKILYDVSQKMKEEQYKALQKAGTDELTGLANRRALEEKLDQRILQNRTFSLIFMDLKIYGKRYLGHDKGDGLKEVRTSSRKYSEVTILARLRRRICVLFEGDAENSLTSQEKNFDFSEINRKIKDRAAIAAPYGR